MADRAFPRTAYHGGSEVGRVFVAGQEAEFIFGRGTQILPALGAEIYGRLDTRVVLDANERWFEMGFKMDHLLSGNSATGWTDAGNYFRIAPEWSPDLLNWSAGKFIPAPAPVVDNGDGSWTYWSRAIHPVDSAVKTGLLEVSSGQIYYGGVGLNINPDTRNNPFTALTILGVVRALGGFPYTMPGEAARMQTDLAAIFPGATVEASAATVWRIRIPNQTFSAFQQLNKVFWPMYLVADMFGVVNSPVDGANFTGNFVNAAGIAIHPKAFGRLKITPGTRYDPFITP
jgi:hypothetical protein